MPYFLRFVSTFFVYVVCVISLGAKTNSQSKLTLDRIFSGEFAQQYEKKIQWIENGNAYITIEKDSNAKNYLVKYDSQTQNKRVYLASKYLTSNKGVLSIESFSLSSDKSKVLIFTNSSRVWRSNTKGDFWVFNLKTKKLKQIGQSLPSSSLMFAKFSKDGKSVYYVHKFNLYRENYASGKLTQLTFDGTDKIINGTFDWAYEEEFGKRDGFSISPDDQKIAYWQIDASNIGTFYMINTTDSIYSKPIPLQYPKVGQTPSSAKIGVLDLRKNTTKWIKIEGDSRENYLPGMQWVNRDKLLIQQLNRHQNKLTIWSYTPSSSKLKKLYVETEETWVDIAYPDISVYGWKPNDLPIVNNGKEFLRMTEKDQWRHIYAVDLTTGVRKLITPFDYDVASMRVATDDRLYFIASPKNATQRYLFSTDLLGKGKVNRITPKSFEGVNNYHISPNGKYAVHTHQSISMVRTVRFISLPDHKTIKTIVDNRVYKNKLSQLDLPKVKFTQVSIGEDISIDVKMVLPPNFNAKKKYPVIFYVYGEPWAQIATDTQISMWDRLMAQKGYAIINMDNRGTPTLKGSKWRKSIYRKIGQLNADDQAKAAQEILKLDYLDETNTVVWGHSGGGSMTLNLMFKYPKIYKTGIARAAVSNQLIYDNIYQERYMGLPQENKQDFIDGSPISYAKGLEGNLLLIHGTGDDNVHYQSAEMLINKLIEHNKQFEFMAYPNRSHALREGKNTRKHLYTLMTNYILRNNPVK